MDPQLFFESPSGKCLKTRQGYWSFVPNPLPPQIEYSGSSVRLLSEASAALGELYGTGNLLPDSSLVITPSIRREAVSSSRIEGTQASLSDLFFFEASEIETIPDSEVQEVQKYVRAMEHGLDHLKDTPLSMKLLKEIHTILVGDVRGDDSAPGEIREGQNWIGPAGCSLYDATYVPPPAEEIEACLGAWDAYLADNQGEPPLIQCALIHYQFEAIHPFTDGNGRIGRLLITFYLKERELLNRPLLYLSEFFDQHKDEYYRRLLAVSQRGDWQAWFEFFLRGVTHQARAAVEYARRLEKLHEEYVKKLGSTKKIPGASHRLLEETFKNPVISVAALSRKWSMPFNSVKKGVQRLVDIGILEETTGKKRDRLYVAPKLMKLLTASEKAREVSG